MEYKYVFLVLVAVAIAIIIYIRKDIEHNMIEGFVPMHKFTVEHIPRLRFATAAEATYPNEYATLFNKIIYPIEIIKTDGSAENIEQLNAGTCDIALVDEDILTTAKDIRQLRGIAIQYMQYFLFLSPFIKSMEELKRTPRKRIGLINPRSNSYSHFMKICKLNNIDPAEDIELIIYDSQREIFTDIRTGKLDGTYLTTNQKNRDLVALTKDIKLYFLNPIPDIAPEYPLTAFEYITFIDRNISAIEQRHSIGYIGEGKPPATMKNPKFEYTRMDDMIADLVEGTIDLIYIGNKNLHRNYILDAFKFRSELLFVSPTRNAILPRENAAIAGDLRKRAFPNSYEYLLNLRAFYKYANADSNLTTYGTRMTLVCREAIPADIIHRIAANLIKHNDAFKENINNYMGSDKLYTYIDTFNIREYSSFMSNVELHEGVVSTYEDNKILKYESVISCE